MVAGQIVSMGDFITGFPDDRTLGVAIFPEGRVDTDDPVVHIKQEMGFSK